MMKQYRSFEAKLKKEWAATLLTIILDQRSVELIVDFINSREESRISKEAAGR